MEVKHQTGKDEGLDVFSGLRTLSMMYVVLGHIFLNYVAGVNTNGIMELLGSTFGVLVQGGFFAVDVFFLMSGFLAGYLLMKRMKNSTDSCCCSVLGFYYHRWFRLVVPLAFTILLALYIFPFLVSGPLSYSYR